MHVSLFPPLKLLAVKHCIKYEKSEQTEELDV